MPKKAKSSPKSTENARIALAALRLANEKGWQAVTLDKVAKAAKVKITLKSSYDLVGIIAATLDDAAWAAITPQGSAHDRLFDLLMARFDELQKHRRAITSMAKTARSDKKLSCMLGKATIDGVYRLIEKSGLTEPARPILAAGLLAIYGWVFLVWQRDDSRDMAKTMAALDRALGWADKGVTLLIPRAR